MIKNVSRCNKNTGHPSSVVPDVEKESHLCFFYAKDLKNHMATYLSTTIKDFF